METSKDIVPLGYERMTSEEYERRKTEGESFVGRKLIISYGPHKDSERVMRALMWSMEEL